MRSEKQPASTQHTGRRDVLEATIDLVAAQGCPATVAAQRHPRALLRLRIITVILVVAFGAVLIFLPLPTWMVWEQVACLVVLAVVALAAKAKSRQ